MEYCAIYPFTHQLSSAYLRSGHGGNRFRKETQASLFPVTLSGSIWGILT